DERAAVARSSRHPRGRRRAAVGWRAAADSQTEPSADVGGPGHDRGLCQLVSRAHAQLPRPDVHPPRALCGGDDRDCRREAVRPMTMTPIRRRIFFSVAAIVMAAAVASAALLGVDIYLHGRYQRSAGFNVWGYRGSPVGK